MEDLTIVDVIQNSLGVRRLERKIDDLIQNLIRTEGRLMATFADLSTAIDTELGEIRVILDGMKARITELELNAENVAAEAVAGLLAEQSAAIDGLITRVSGISESLTEVPEDVVTE